METKLQKLGEILVQNSLITPEQLREALVFQEQDNRRLGEILLEKGFIDDLELSKYLAKAFHISFRRLQVEDFDLSVLNKIPLNIIESHQILPVAYQNEQLVVAINDPLNISALQDVEYKTGLRVLPVMVCRADMQHCFKEILSKNAISFSVAASSNTDSEGGESTTNLVDNIIRQAIHEGASDIHWEPQYEIFLIRFRIDGILYEKHKLSKKIERKILSRIKVLCGMDVAESRRPQDGRMTFLDDGEYELRASTLPNIIGENMVLRVLNKSYSSQSFSSLGMSDHDLGLMHNIIEKPFGLFLVTGPTGSGKTTTLYSVLNQLNEKSKCIISVEDPVEYELQGISQTMVNRQLGYSFANAMKSILRHDPDIIMVGEIRDKETAEMAIQAALTGHLVLSTIHTNNAAGAVTRLLEMDIEPFLISSALNGIVAQRLVRRLCPKCKQEYTPDTETSKIIHHSLPDAPITSIARQVGCPACLETGYLKRFAIFEILPLNDAIRQLILHKANEPELIECARKNGMRDLRQAGLKQVLAKETSMAEVIRMTIAHD